MKPWAYKVDQITADDERVSLWGSTTLLSLRTRLGRLLRFLGRKSDLQQSEIVVK